MIQPDGPEAFYLWIPCAAAAGAPRGLLYRPREWNASSADFRGFRHFWGAPGRPRRRPRIAEPRRFCGPRFGNRSLLVKRRPEALCQDPAVGQTRRRDWAANGGARAACDIRSALQPVERLDALGEHAADPRARLDAAMEP